jgi:hypothetical protein
VRSNVALTLKESLTQANRPHTPHRERPEVKGVSNQERASDRDVKAGESPLYPLFLFIYVFSSPPYVHYYSMLTIMDSLLRLLTMNCTECGKWFTVPSCRQDAKYKWRCPDCSTARRKLKEKAACLRQVFKRDYGITVADRDKMIEDQGGICMLCGKNDSRLQVDHDHKSGRVRGMLCKHCNLMLGHAKDNSETLEKAVSYLRKNKEDGK